MMVPGIDVHRDSLLSELISWENIVVIHVEDVELIPVHVVTRVPVALMRVKVNNHELLVAKPLFHIVSHEGDVWINTESLSVVSASMMETSAQVDGPASVLGNDCGLH